MLLCAPNTETPHCRLQRGPHRNRHTNTNLCVLHPLTPGWRCLVDRETKNKHTHFRDCFRIRNKTKKFVVVIKFRAFKPRLTGSKCSVGHSSTCGYWMYLVRVGAPYLKLSTLKAPATNKSTSPNLQESLTKFAINKPLTGAIYQYFWCLAIETKVSSCWHAIQKKKTPSCFLDTIVQLLDKLHLLWSEGSWTFSSAYLTHTPQYQLQFQKELHAMFSA